MTVRDRVGRTRYVALRVEGGPFPRTAVGGLLPEGAKLTRFDGEFGVVRTTHRDRDALLRVLKDVARISGREARIETLRTSGTLRAAARALPSSSPASRRAPRAG